MLIAQILVHLFVFLTFVVTVLDVHAAGDPSTPIMVSSYTSSTPVIYGGDTVSVSCSADTGTYDSDGGIVWKLVTKIGLSIWSGFYDGMPMRYPQWVTINSVPGR